MCHQPVLAEHVMDVEHVEDVLDRIQVLGGIPEELRSDIVKPDDGCKRNEHTDLVPQVPMVLSQCAEHLTCAL